MKDCIAASVILLSLLFGLPWLSDEPQAEKGEEVLPPSG